MDNLNTFDSITNSFKKMATSKEPIDPSTWLSGALKLNVLLEAEQEKLIEMEFQLASMRKDILEKDHTATYTKMIIEADPLYKCVQQQKARIKNAQDLILLAKKHATLSSELMRSNL